jgi:hypothetical protein
MPHSPYSPNIFFFEKNGTYSNSGKYCSNIANTNIVLISGHFRPIFVRPEGRNIRGGGHVRSADGHDPARVPDQNRSLQRTQSGLQRRAFHVQKSKIIFLVGNILKLTFFQKIKLFLPTMFFPPIL